jgi:hypothetical protein
VTLLITMILLGVATRVMAFRPQLIQPRWTRTLIRRGSTSTSTTTSNTIETVASSNHPKKGRLLILGGTGYLGQEVCQKAVQAGYSVVALSRRGVPTSSSSSSSAALRNHPKIDYRKGDARQKESIVQIIQEGNICGIVHCIGLLFDTASGLGNYNVYVSGSKSLPTIRLHDKRPFMRWMPFWNTTTTINSSSSSSSSKK